MPEEPDMKKTGSLAVMEYGDIHQHMTDQVFQGKGLLPGRALLVPFLLRAPTNSPTIVPLHQRSTHCSDAFLTEIHFFNIHF